MAHMLVSTRGFALFTQQDIGRENSGKGSNSNTMETLIGKIFIR